MKTNTEIAESAGLVVHFFTNLQLSSYLELRFDEVYGLIAVT
jgi:hypothetical protein